MLHHVWTHSLTHLSLPMVVAVEGLELTLLKGAHKGRESIGEDIPQMDQWPKKFIGEFVEKLALWNDGEIQMFTKDGRMVPLHKGWASF